MIRKTLVTLALTAGMVGGTAGIASAHECYVANRSEKGDAGANRSQSWETVQQRELYESAHLFLSTPDVQHPALTPAQVDEALRRSSLAGVPLTFTTFKAMIPGFLNGDHEATSPKSFDGKGVDHFFTRYGATVIGIYFEVAYGGV